MPTRIVAYSLDEYRHLLDLAFATGIRNVPIRTGFPVAPFLDARHQRKFLAACHRGYEKAQTQIIDLLHRLGADNSVKWQERQFSELLLRKVADGMAVILLQHKTHFIRRLVLHDSAPGISLDNLMRASKVADSLNRESRMTFAILADLTTFIHVAERMLRQRLRRIRFRR